MAKSKYAVRIENISLENFKNIGKGSVFFNEFKKLERKDFSDPDYSNVLGIYGQNASGKTSIIDALGIVRHLISGGGMTPGLQNYIKKGTDNFGISISFLLFNDSHANLVTYSIDVKMAKNIIFIENETLSSMSSDSESLRFEDKKVLYSYSQKTGLKDSFISLINSKEQKTILNYLASSKTNMPANQITATLFSSLFNLEVIQILKKEEKLNSLMDIIDSLVDFCKNKFMIVTTNLFDGINMRGVGVNGFDFDDNQDRIHKNFSILFGRQVLEESKYKSFLKMLDASAKVLETLIPGLSIKPHVYNETTDFSGKKAIEFEVMSVRDNKEIPLFFESRGVKQMLTYVGDLIGVFNQEGMFIAVDELDSGVFEYLLGEIIYSFDNFALGQLLFTSHNFRILEKIKPSEIFFTTANENNKFMQPKYIKNNNNLRDVYYRLIVQGDDKETYYNKASSADISKTLSSLGRGHRWKDAC